MTFDIDNSLQYNSGIYAIRNCIDDRFYIGSTKGFFGRYKEHLRLLKKGIHFNKYVQAFVNKYGVETLSFELLFLCKNTCLRHNEKLWIDILKPQFNLKKIINRVYLEDVEKYTLKVMAASIEEADKRIAEKLFMETGLIWMGIQPNEYQNVLDL